MKAFLKQLLLRLGVSIRRHYVFYENRVTLGGIRRAIKDINTKFPNLSKVIIVDSEFDRNSKRFYSRFERVIQASGRPEEDLGDFNKDSIIVLGFNSDWLASRYLRYAVDHNIKFICSHEIINANYWNLNEKANSVLIEGYLECKKNSYTHFEPEQLANIIQAIDLTQDVPGVYIEIGVFNGTSARTAYHYINRAKCSRSCYFVDTFEGFDYPEAQQSPDAFWSNTHNANINLVEDRLRQVNRMQLGDEGSNFKVVKSNIISDELPEEITQVAICNIDVDMYEAIKSSLMKIHSLVPNQGVIIVQDPGRTPFLGGARLALDEFLNSIMGKSYTPLYFESGQTLLLKTK